MVTHLKGFKQLSEFAKVAAKQDKCIRGIHWHYCSWMAEKIISLADDTDLIGHDANKYLQILGPTGRLIYLYIDIAWEYVLKRARRRLPPRT